MPLAGETLVPSSDHFQANRDTTPVVARNSAGGAVVPASAGAALSGRLSGASCTHGSRSTLGRPPQSTYASARPPASSTVYVVGALPDTGSTTSRLACAGPRSVTRVR